MPDCSPALQHIHLPCMKTAFTKYVSALVAFTGIFSLCSKAQSATAPDNKSLLWEVTGNKLQKPVYIFGTMHLLCAKDAVISENLRAIIKKSSAIYFETDMDDMAGMFNGMTAGAMRHDTTLENLYTPEEYERIENFFSEHGMGMQFKMLNNMQPMLVSALIYQALLPCTQTGGMELSIMQLATRYRKEIRGLETVAYQAEILNSIPYEVQAKELLHGVDSTDTFEEQTKKMIELYKEQDIEKLLQFSVSSDSDMNEHTEEMLLNTRNANWTGQFEDISGEGNILIAVGAGHLGGKKGLLNLLKQQGYTARAIENITPPQQ